MVGSAVRALPQLHTIPRTLLSALNGVLDRAHAAASRTDANVFGRAGSNMDGQLGVGVSGNVTELQPLVRLQCEAH